MHWWVREAFRTNIVRCDAGTDVSINVTQFRTISLTYNYIYIYTYVYIVWISIRLPTLKARVHVAILPNLNGQKCPDLHSAMWVLQRKLQRQ